MSKRPFLSLCAFFFAGALAPAGFAQTKLECDLSQSHVEVIVKATVDSFTGHLEKFDSAVTLDDSGRITEATFRFQFADLKTGRDRRDRAMIEWENTARFPGGEYRLETLTPDAGGRWLARGNLTLHGETHALQFPVSILTEQAICVIDGEAVIDTRDYGLPLIRVWGVVKVDPLVHVRFHLQGRRGTKP